MVDKQKIFSGPLSQRARKILKSFYGLESERIVSESKNDFSQPKFSVEIQPDLDQQALLKKKAPVRSPTLPRYFKSNVFSKLLNTVGINQHKTFSKSRYIRESKGSNAFQLLVAIGILLLCFVLIFLSDFKFFKSEVNSIKSRVGNIQDIVDKTNSINSSLEIQRGLLEKKKQTYTELRDQVYDQNSIKDLVTKFLAELENNRITVKISIARFSNTPVYEAKNVEPTAIPGKGASPGTDRAKDAARVLTNKEPIANQVANPATNQAVPGARNKVDKNNTPVNIDAAGVHSLPGDSELAIPYDANRLGINYYYIKLELSGAYLNYLAARQQLIDLVPGVIIESEKVTSQNNKSTVTIVVGINLPFYQEKN
ncbi:hypothetical protein FD977_02800 [Polynucleobacter sp. AP-Elch-400A-B2]|uniref:hypothetical protein n=1 Tax=Polynucleobacter sp. AP-Elch-400A-B2 TaxID=2576930 RepID=UPI001BFD34AD|nr:hypothetical protein [Polynucleobacter sp. AP-Elch-400A-B2]QWE25208.1 hypothetical protein FD977_02800 [Polynucleobacter sp. AP-Elch-400A-B2]